MICVVVIQSVLVRRRIASHTQRSVNPAAYAGRVKAHLLGHRAPAWRGGPQSLDRLAANLRWYLLSIICCQIEQSSSSLSRSKLYCRCCGVRGREARKCGQAVCNALALHRGCPHGPQGSRRSEGLVHKSTAQGAPVVRALGPGDFLQPLDYPSSLPAGGPRSPAPKPLRALDTHRPCRASGNPPDIRRSQHRRPTPPGPGIGRRHAPPPASARQTLNADVVRCSSSPTRRSRRGPRENRQTPVGTRTRTSASATAAR